MKIGGRFMETTKKNQLNQKIMLTQCEIQKLNARIYLN